MSAAARKRVSPLLDDARNVASRFPQADFGRRGLPAVNFRIARHPGGNVNWSQQPFRHIQI
jgi:hypothetical protein